MTANQDELVTVRLDSEAYGIEAFPYEGIDEAVAGIKRLWLKCMGCVDGVERTISITVTPEGDEAESQRRLAEDFPSSQESAADAAE